MVQVIRDDYVTNVPVRVLGETGTERVQIAGALRSSDSLIASTSVPLLAGTLVRFGDNGGEARMATPPAEPRPASRPAGGRGRSPAPGPGERTPGSSTASSGPPARTHQRLGTAHSEPAGDSDQ